MYIADMHCDSLLKVSSDDGLISKYNVSREYPSMQIFAAFVPKMREDPAIRRKRLMRYLNVYSSECTRLDITPVRECIDLNYAITMEKRSSILSIEGGGGLFSDSEELTTVHKMGVRVMGLCWDSNELASSAFGEVDTGLTDEGIRMVDRLSEMGIIIDVSHMSDKSVAQTLERTAYPVIATHSNFREVCDVKRNLPRSIASEIASRGGVIGLNLYPGFLRTDGECRMDDLIRHIEYGLESFGEDVLGFGFDIDGTGGEYPIGIDESSSIHDRVTEMLLSRYSENLVKKIAGENVINFFKNNL